MRLSPVGSAIILQSQVRSQHHGQVGVRLCWPIKIHDINNNRIIKIIIVLEAELEPTRRLGIYLVLVTILNKILDSS
jgi:hypothetical protein